MDTGTDLSFPILLSVTSLVLGVSGVTRGLQMRYGGRLDLVSDLDYRALPNPGAWVQAFSGIYLKFGTLLTFLPAMLLFGVPLLIFGICLAIVVWVWFEAIERTSHRARRSSSRGHPS